MLLSGVGGSEVLSAAAIGLSRVLEAGLVVRVWPGERVLIGLRVSHWLRDELLRFAPVVLKSRQSVLEQWDRLPHDFDGTAIEQTLRQFGKHHVTFRWTGMLDNSIYSIAVVQALKNTVSAHGIRNNLVHVDLQDIQPTTGQVLADVLSSYTSLQTLGLAVLSGLLPFQRVFANNCALRDLDVAWSHVELEAIRPCTSLTRLKLSNCILRGTDPTFDQVLSCILRNNTRLTQLDLHNVQDPSREVEISSAKVMAALATQRNLTSLNLNNFVQLTFRTPTLALAEVMKCNALRHLNISNARLGAFGAAVLAQALAECQTLEILAMGWNRLEADGAGILGESVHWSRLRRLHTLDLQHNQMTNGGVATVASALARSLSLRVVYLAGNDGLVQDADGGLAISRVEPHAVAALEAAPGHCRVVLAEFEGYRWPNGSHHDPVDAMQRMHSGMADIPPYRRTVT